MAFSGKLIIVSAPSGAGKTTLCQRLLAELGDQLVLSVSCTTRAPRGTEKDGVEYHFLTREDFEARARRSEFAEWARVHDRYYGTLKSTVTDAWSRGKHVLLDIDVQGAASLRKAFPGQTYCVFITPPDLESLEARLRARGTESEASIATRMANAKAEMARENEFDCIIVNRDLESAAQELVAKVKAVLL